MDLKDMRCFVAVYDAKSFSRASIELGTVQSNVSVRIRNLERSLGVRLFVRLHKAIVPTDKGHELYVHAKHMLATLNYTERLMREEIRPLRA